MKEFLLIIAIIFLTLSTNFCRQSQKQALELTGIAVVNDMSDGGFQYLKVGIAKKGQKKFRGQSQGFGTDTARVWSDGTGASIYAAWSKYDSKGSKHLADCYKTGEGLGGIKATGNTHSGITLKCTGSVKYCTYKTVKFNGCKMGPYQMTVDASIDQFNRYKNLKVAIDGGSKSSSFHNSSRSWYSVADITAEIYRCNSSTCKPKSIAICTLQPATGSNFSEIAGTVNITKSSVTCNTNKVKCSAVSGYTITGCAAL